MSFKRIVTVVVLVVAALVAVCCVYDWASVGQITAYVKSGINARLNPDEWHLGDVRVVKSGAYEAWDMASYSAFSDEDSLVFTVVGKSASGSPYEAVSAPVPANGWPATLLPSDRRLEQDALTPEAAEAAAYAEAFVAKMRQFRPWPWTLRPISGLMSDIAQHSYRLETLPVEPTFVLLTEYVYGNETAYQVIHASALKRIHLLPGNCVVLHSGGRAGLVLSEGGIVVYADDEGKAQQLIDETRTSLDLGLTVLRASPGIAPAVVERLTAAQNWLASRKFKLLPPPEGYGMRRMARPWETPIRDDAPGSVSYSSEPQIQPITISGVELSEVRVDSSLKGVQLARGGDIFQWRSYPGKSTLRLVRSGYPSFYLTIPDRQDYPAVASSFTDARVNDVLMSLRGMAQDLLAAPAQSWPDAAWRDDLRTALKAFAQGRFYARSSHGVTSVEARLVFEGSGSWALFAQCAGSYDLEEPVLDLALLPDGFAVHDTYSGCLLELTGGAATMTQTRESAEAGESLHLTEAAALAEWASTSADKLPPGLAASLAQAREFLASPSLPVVKLVDSMEVPEWSLAKFRERVPARKPGCYG